MSWDDNLVAFVAALRPLADEAQSRGLRLCVEPHPKQVVYDGPTTARMYELLGSDGDGVGVCFDAANLAATGHDPIAYVRRFADKISMVHVKDLERWRGPGHPPSARGWVSYGPQPPLRFRAVPWEELDWGAIHDALVEEGVVAPMVLENQDVMVDRDRGLVESLAHLERLSAVRGPQARWW